MVPKWLLAMAANSEDDSLGTKSFALVLLQSSIPIILTVMFYRRRRGSYQKRPIICPAVPQVPSRHPLLGHLPLGFYDRDTLFTKHANVDGISHFFIMREPCLSVLKASHCRALLRNSIDREGSRFQYHGFRTMGKESLIFISGGSRWKKQRVIVQKAFTEKSMAGSVAGIWVLAQRLSLSLASSCDVCRQKFRSKLRMNVFPLMKLYSLEVFGAVSLGYEFGNITGREDYSPCHLQDPQNSITQPNAVKNNEDDEKSSSIYRNMSPEAKACEFLILDINLRTRPSSYLNPFLQFYWMPTAHNRNYAKMGKIVDNLLHRVIHYEKERLAAEGQKHDLDEKQNISQVSNGDEGSSCNASHSTPICFSPKQDQSTSSKQNDRKDNLLTYFIRSNPDATPSDLIQNLKTLLFAGFETTSITLSYSLYCLATHPRCQERMAEEVMRVSDWVTKNDVSKVNSDDNSTKDHIENCIPDEEHLAYTRAVLLETMRLHPAIITTLRVLRKPMKLGRSNDNGDNSENGSYSIPANTKIFVPVDKVHLDERNFDRPQEFLPERWVQWVSSDCENDQRGYWVDRDPEREHAEAKPTNSQKNAAQKMEEADSVSAAKLENFLAFSDGARNCVGRRLALTSSTLGLASIIRSVKVEMDNGYILRKRKKLISLPPEEVILVLSARGQ